MDLQKWAEREIQALIDVGQNPHDAEAIVKRILDRLPPGADPETWIPGTADLQENANITDADVLDARADWYAADDVPNRFKRLLDAKDADQ